MTGTIQATHDSDAMADPHGADHGDDDHGDDDHGQADGEPLGPVDLIAWGAGILGIGAGLAVALVIAASTGSPS